MPRLTILEEFHLTVSAPARLASAELNGLLRTVRSASFQARLREAVRDVVKRYPSLRKARFGIDR